MAWWACPPWPRNFPEGNLRLTIPLIGTRHRRGPITIHSRRPAGPRVESFPGARRMRALVGPDHAISAPQALRALRPAGCSRNRRPNNRNQLCPRPAAEADEPRYIFAPTDPQTQHGLNSVIVPAKPRVTCEDSCGDSCEDSCEDSKTLGVLCNTLPPGFFFFFRSGELLSRRSNWL